MHTLSELAMREMPEMWAPSNKFVVVLGESARAVSQRNIFAIQWQRMLDIEACAARGDVDARK